MEYTKEAILNRIESKIHDSLKGNGWQLINGDVSEILCECKLIRAELGIPEYKDNDINWGM